MEDEYMRNVCLRDTWRKGNMECAIVPINPNSNGIWPSPRLPDPKANIPYYDYTFPYLEMTFLIIFFLWLFFHFFLRRLGMIRFTSQILTGILLGKSIFKEGSSVRHFFATHDYKETVLGLWGGFAYTMFWFLMGVKMDVGLIRSIGTKAITIGVSSALLSVLVCSICYFKNVFYVGVASGGQSLSVGEAVVIYAVQCLSTFPVVGNLLFELNIQNSELGRLAMSSAVVSDLIGSISSSLLIFVKELEAEKTRLGRLFVGDIQNGSRSVQRALIVVVFVFFAIYVFRPLMFYIIKRTPEGRPVKSNYINATVVFVFGSAVLAHMCKQFVPMGPFILGLAVPHGPPLGSAFTERFEPAIFGVFLPLFAATSATEIDIGILLDKSSLPKNLQALRLMLLSFIIKLVSTAVPALVFRMPAVDSLALSLILSFEGIFELGSYALALQRGSIRHETFSITSLYILVSSAIIPPILRYMYDPSRIYAGYKKRNIMNLKPNSELRILSGIYRTDDIRPMINLLEATCPTKDRPVAAYVLHLIELVGQANPVFVSHQMQTRKSGSLSYSDNVIISFEQFRKDFFGSVAISTYTAMSNPKGMHDDICMVALNNDTSLIVLPFHLTWSADGLTVVSDNKMIRSLNENVLELSPCSVGIFAYRSSSGRRTISDTASQDSLYRICMIFLGGKDDREALTLAKRMACDSRISLTVVHLVSSNYKISEQTDWETMLDSVQIRDVKNRMEGSERTTYVEEVLQDASDTPKLLKSMATDYDMFIVGRGKGRNSPLTRGLEQWSEFKELGVIGDLLISQDLNCQASVLLVQQQKLMI